MFNRREYQRRYRQTPEGRAATRDGNRRYRQTPKGRQAQQRVNRKTNLRQYGITPEDYDAMLIAQGGMCAICKRPPKPVGNRQRLCVDHAHDTKKIRGLLCRNCNRGLGNFYDDPLRLRLAAEYLDV